jgi:hypothetical protein
MALTDRLQTAGFSADSLRSLAVSRPPSNRDGAMAPAKEQYAFCYDIVEQGTETTANLAGGLLNGRSWFFWWE